MLNIYLTANGVGVARDLEFFLSIDSKLSIFWTSRKSISGQRYADLNHNNWLYVILNYYVYIFNFVRLRLVFLSLEFEATELKGSAVAENLKMLWKTPTTFQSGMKMKNSVMNNTSECTMYDFHDSTDTLKFWTEKRAINNKKLFFFRFWWNLVKL